jgi:hypothetical protein
VYGKRGNTLHYSVSPFTVISIMDTDSDQCCIIKDKFALYSLRPEKNVATRFMLNNLLILTKL